VPTKRQLWWNKGGEGEEKQGRWDCGFSPKIHIRGEGKGKPITFVLSPGQRNESIFLEKLMELLTSKRILVPIVRAGVPKQS